MEATKLESTKYETIYELSKSNQIDTEIHVCALCGRYDGEIVGPFIAKGQPTVYLHSDCIEINQFSYFNVSAKKWVNIDTMLKKLQNEVRSSCYRCDGKGASVECVQCGRCFHGYFCAGLYLIQGMPRFKPNLAVNPQTWVCLFC
jgi:hypothetical protein